MDEQRIWLRIDCDNPLFYHRPSKCPLDFRGYLNWFSLATNIHIPILHLEAIYETKKFLQNYDIPRIWFFRPITCPDSWDEPFGLHATYKQPEKFQKEYEYIKKKLGPFKYFTRHGIRTYVKRGDLWTEEDVKKVEQLFGLKDLEMPHYFVGRTKSLDLPSVKCVLIHERDILHAKCELEYTLKKMIEWNSQSRVFRS